jgi:hypothetical protein
MLGQEPTGDNHRRGKSPANQDRHCRYHDEYPPQPERWALAARFHGKCPADKADAQGQVDEEKAGEEGG